MTARKGTYSIVARDLDTGELGVAVQSHWFSVGSIVSWAEPGVGAVATQSIAEPAYGPRLLERLRGGQAPRQALDALLAADEQAGVRQVAVVDASGAVAVHTGLLRLETEYSLDYMRDCLTKLIRANEPDDDVYIRLLVYISGTGLMATSGPVGSGEGPPD